MNTAMSWKSFVICVLAVMIVPLVVAQAPTPDAASLYKSKCVVCHRADGAGKSAMKNTDLRTSAVQKQTDAQLQMTLANGKDKMPAYKDKLTQEQIAGLVKFVRTFAGSAATKPALMDLNSATREQLMTLPGISTATAGKIIAARPYKAKADLVRKTVLTKTAYNKIATKVTANQPTKAMASRQAVADTTTAVAQVTIPQGTKLSVRLVDAIDSSVNKAGDDFRATLDTPIVIAGDEVVPKYADVTGRVVNVESAGHFTGRSEVGLVLTSLTAGGKTYDLKTTALAKEGSSRGVRTAMVVGGGAAAGALIGALTGGGKGAAIGGAAGTGAGAGVQAFTHGEQVQFPSETVLEFELQEATTSVPAGLTTTPATTATVVKAPQSATLAAPATVASASGLTLDSLTPGLKNAITGAVGTTTATTAPTAASSAVTASNKAELPVASSTVSASGLSVGKITDGLKEALAVGTGNAVAATGKPDGFLGNAAIKILLPDKLRTLGSSARYLGMGSQVDELEVGMNRAAEQATPYARQIFLDAVSKMSFADARKIWSGDDTAATDYFKSQTSAQLTTAFKPIVHNAMENVGVIKLYNALTQNSIAGSLGGQGFSLDDYVVGKSLDGLFYMLGQEEKKIRTDPWAQTTSLLKEVFGKRP